MAESVDAVRAARQHTIASRSARITCNIEFTWSPPESPVRQDRSRLRSAVLVVSKAGAEAVGKGVLRLAAGRSDLQHQRAEGFIDFAGRRYLIDYGSYAALHIRNQQWSGRSGRALSTLPVEPAGQTSPVWLMDLLAGITSAQEVGSEPDSSKTWRHFAATANLAEASAASPDGMHSPAQDRFEKLLKLPFEVWLDSTDIRQIRFGSDHRCDTMTLSEFGTGVADLDWTRLPTFNTPQEERADDQ